MLRLRPATFRPVDLDQIRHDYEKSQRPWHVTGRELAQWHQYHLYPCGPRDDRLLDELPVPELRALKRAEEQAFDRFFNARAVLIEAQRTEAASG